MSSDFPTSLPSKLRSCKLCSALSPLSKFKSKGCPNCTTVPKDSDFTSPRFKGLIGLVDPSRSWVALWQRISTCKRGVYSMVVEGEVEEEILIEYEKSGQTYTDRNESFKL
ncbi:transcription elongation factor SPT4 [Vairimorpha necatrix]|uniref:Transcription elongation factor SPT4 n=1 Tax=Vairimorpha necatrix TaxID=6039 RepID=A0AAX4JF67_9MICR